ncbi:MAG TPA: VWA domain-containing protein [Bryobacteraceae bacterium]|nr:VWA domain-containing protein [Bryobacteraceae bacterium]
MRALLAVFSACAVAALGQSDPQATAPPTGALESTTAFRADSTLVLVPVSVTDPSNRYVLGLEKEAFHLSEDDVPQTIRFFSNEDAPLSIGLLVDVSGSMGAKLETSRRAVIEFLKTLNAADEAFLVDFSDRAELAMPLTSNAEAIETKLTEVTSGGLTAMLDAVHTGLQEMKHAKNPRKALLIISDGGDNNSRFTATEIEDLVREADVQIYAMGVFEPVLSFGLGKAGAAAGLGAAEISGPKLLSEIADQTGGRAMAASSLRDLPGIAERIGIELRNQYVLAYSPINKNRDGKYRKVQVKVDQPKALPALKARWRAGYYAPND